MYIQINIGRNFSVNEFNKTPGELSDLEWGEFVMDVKTLILNYRENTMMGGDDFPSEHYGTGIWNGVEEESAHISMYHEGGFELEGIREQLHRLKKYYSQDNIALIVGSELI